MTKMAAMSIYGKNPSKIFFSRTGGPISKKLGMKHRWLKYNNVYINLNHDPLVTLTYFTTILSMTYNFHPENGKYIKYLLLQNHKVLSFSILFVAKYEGPLC